MRCINAVEVLLPRKVVYWLLEHSVFLLGVSLKVVRRLAAFGSHLRDLVVLLDVAHHRVFFLNVLLHLRFQFQVGSVWSDTRQWSDVATTRPLWRGEDLG